MDNNFTNSLIGTKVSSWRYFDSIESTNSEALDWAESGAPDFSLVLADEQTKGRGRFDRHWITQPGASLAFSIILRPTEREKEVLSLFSPLCAIAVQNAVEGLLNLPTSIKWPNDILVMGRKFCGILVEAVWRKTSLQGMVLGIGINVNHCSVPPLTAQSFPATSLENAFGRALDRYALLNAVLLALDVWRGKIGSHEFMQRWQDSLAYKGQWVKLENSEKAVIIGKIEGIDESGQLVLSDGNGVRTSVMVGEVHLRPLAANDAGGKDA